MKIKDEALWHQMIKELKKTEAGVAFHDFVVGWCERAEQVIGQEAVSNPADALRLTLADAEDVYGRKNIWILGQALVVICMHWGHGDDTATSFTELEVRLVEDITAAKIAQLQADAEQGNVPPE